MYDDLEKDAYWKQTNDEYCKLVRYFHYVYNEIIVKWKISVGNKLRNSVGDSFISVIFSNSNFDRYENIQFFNRNVNDVYRCIFPLPGGFVLLKKDMNKHYIYVTSPQYSENIKIRKKLGIERKKIERNYESKNKNYS